MRSSLQSLKKIVTADVFVKPDWLSAAACIHQLHFLANQKREEMGKTAAGSWKEPELMEERGDWERDRALEEREKESRREERCWIDGGWAGVKEVLTW